MPAQMYQLRVKGRKGDWWIHGVPSYEADGEIVNTCGPYLTKAEALSDCRGLQRTLDQMARDEAREKKGTK